MIAFDSPEGTRLRDIPLSRSAVTMIWLTAVDEGRGDWASWARDGLATQVSGADLAAMGFVQAAMNGEIRRAMQLWSILATFPADEQDSRMVRAAHDLRAALPI